MLSRIIDSKCCGQCEEAEICLKSYCGPVKNGFVVEPGAASDINIGGGCTGFPVNVLVWVLMDVFLHWSLSFFMNPLAFNHQ